LSIYRKGFYKIRTENQAEFEITNELINLTATG